MTYPSISQLARPPPFVRRSAPKELFHISVFFGVSHEHSSFRNQAQNQKETGLA